MTCLARTLALALLATAVGGTTVRAESQPAVTHTETQEVCVVGDPTGRDVFSVGELRTSILSQTAFQELNGAEWVLADGRPLLVRTALSPHLSQTPREERGSEYGLMIPDVRGRFLRMANNNVCADLRGDETAYDECLAGRDPGGDRLTGEFQPDGFREHAHGYVDRTNAWPREDAPDGAKMWAAFARHWVIPDPRLAREFARTTERTGGTETRPKNIAVNFYIKICDCRTPHCR